MNPQQIMSIIGAYNSDPRSFTDEEAEMIAMLASQFGIKFNRENKAVSKGLFNFADVGLFGMLPNEWEPYSRGESVYGESFSEKAGSNIGSVAGLLPALLTGGALLRGGVAAAKGAMGLGKGARGVSGGGGAAGGGATAAAAPYAEAGQNLRTAGRSGGGMLQLTGRPMRNLNPNSRKSLRRNKIDDEIMRRAGWNYERSYLDTATIPAGYRSIPLTIGERLRMTESGFGAAPYDDVWDMWNPRNIIPY
jgi:hypothetical protein